MANGGPQIVPAPLPPQAAPSRFRPQPVMEPRRFHPLAYIGRIGPQIVAAQQQREQMQMNRQDRIRDWLFQVVQNDPDINLANVAPADTDVQTWNQVNEYQKSLKRIRKEQSAEQNVPNIAALVSRAQQEKMSGPGQKPGPYGALASQAIEMMLNQLGGPQTASAQRMSRDIAAQVPIARGIRMEALEAEGRQEATTIRAENRARRVEVIDAVAMGIAAGVKEDVAREHLVANGLRGKQLTDAMAQAKALALERRAMLTSSASGVTEYQGKVRNRFALLQEESGGTIWGPGGREREVRESDAANIVNGFAAPVELDGDTYLVTNINTSQGVRKMQEIEGLRAVLSEMAITEQHYDAVAAKIESGQIASLGPYRPEFFQSWLRFAGSQDPDYAAYATSYFLTTADLLKAKQGSRPSDFDFKNFLAMYPLSTEIGTPAGRARINTLRELTRANLLAKLNPRQAERIAKIRAEQRQLADKRLDAPLDKAWARYQRVLQNHEDGKISNDRLAMETAKLLDVAQDWKASGGAAAYQHGIMGVPGAPVSSANSDLVKQITSGGLLQ